MFTASSKCFLNILTRRMISSKLPSEGLEGIAYERALLLARALKCTPSYALQIIGRKQFFLKYWDHVEKTLTFLGEKLAVTDIARNYEVLTLRNERVEQRYTILQEIGVTNITAEDITRYPQIVSSTPSQLQQTNCIPREWDPTNGMLVHLQCNGNLANIVREKLLQQNHWTKMSIKCIRSNILVNYLSWRLEFLPEEVSSLLNRHRSIGAKSFQHLQATLNLMINEYKFPLQHIRRHIYILNASPENLQNISNSPILSKLDIKKIILIKPRITRLLCSNLEKVVQILHSYEISDEQVHHCKTIFFLSPEIVKQRLESMQTMPELWSMKGCDRFLCLLYSYEIAKKQLDSLKQAGHIAISLNMLIKYNLDDSISTGNDKCQGRECIEYFAKFFHKSRSEVKKNLNRHPNMYRISLINSQKILEEFVSLGLSETQLWNSLFIVLYDYGAIMENFGGLKDRPELQPFETWTNQPLLLDLVVYFMERELRFSGAGVFCTPNLVKDTSTGTTCVPDIDDFAENDDSDCLESNVGPRMDKL